MSFDVIPVDVETENLASNDESAVRFAVEHLLKMTGSELDAYNQSQNTDFESAVPAGTTFLGVKIDTGVVTINLGGAIVGSSGSSSEESMFAEQLTRTALLNSSLTGIRLEMNGVAVDELWGHIDWSEPLSL
jgi:spore germination protein GerM